MCNDCAIRRVFAIRFFTFLVPLHSTFPLPIARARSHSGTKRTAAAELGKVTSDSAIIVSTCRTLIPGMVVSSTPRDAISLVERRRRNCRFHRFSLLHRIFGRRQIGGICLGFELTHKPVHLILAPDNVSLILAIELKRQLRCEQMLLSIVSHQAFRDGLSTRLNPVIAEFLQCVYVSVSREDRVQNCQPCRSSDVADDVVQLQVHLIQRPLHILNMAGRHLY